MANRSPEREQFLADVLICAVEGGTGYWAYTYQYKWMDKETGEQLPPAAVFATLIDMEEFEDDDAKTVAESAERIGKTLNIDVVAEGVNKIVNDDGFRINSTLRQTIKECSKENDAGMIDAELADCITQAALFGSLVYG